jgi:PTH1 family peptidyl-tRNA hydrolase
VKERVPGYVLHDFAKSDAEWLSPLLDAIAEHAPLLAEGKDSTFANRLHEALAARPDERGSPDKSAEKPIVSSKTGPSPDLDTPHDGPLARGLRRLFGRH